MHRDLSNFAPGLDTRRSILTSQPGTLQTLQDAHVNQGAEIDKRLAFVDLGALPSGTFGFESVQGGVIVFGSEATPAGLPANTSYQRLQHPNGITSMSKVLCSCSFGGSAFVVAQFADNAIFMFWNGTLISSSLNGQVIDTSGSYPYTTAQTNTQIAQQLANFIGGLSGLAVGNVTLNAGVTSFLMWSTSSLAYSPVVSEGSTNTGSGTISATNVSTFITGIIAAGSTTSFLITGGSSGGSGAITGIEVYVGGSWVEILGTTVSFGGNFQNVPIVSDAQMAEAIAAQIDAYATPSQNLSAVATNNTVTITYNSTLGATPNGYGLRVICSGDACVDNTVMDFSQNTGSVSGIGCSSIKV